VHTYGAESRSLSLGVGGKNRWSGLWTKKCYAKPTVDGGTATAWCHLCSKEVDKRGLDPQLCELI